jgi:hypothetical protein
MLFTLSMTGGKSGRAKVRRIDRPCVEGDLLCGVESRVNGNSNGVDGDQGRDGSCRMWSMSEPAGIPGGGGFAGGRMSAGLSGGGGSAGGRTSAWSGVGGKGGRAMSCRDMWGSSGVQSSGVGVKAHEAKETEGARVVEAGVMSPGEGVWSDPTH